MKLNLKLLAATSVAALLAAAITLCWLVYDWTRDVSPSTYVRWLDTNVATYDTVDSIAASELPWHAYAYDENKLVNAIPGAKRLPDIADISGRLPAFKLDGDIFVVTWKGLNASAGLAISDSPDFIAKITRLDTCFRVRHVSGSIYEWDLDLETSRAGADR